MAESLRAAITAMKVAKAKKSTPKKMKQANSKAANKEKPKIKLEMPLEKEEQMVAVEPVGNAEEEVDFGNKLVEHQIETSGKLQQMNDHNKDKFTSIEGSVAELRGEMKELNSAIKEFVTAFNRREGENDRNEIEDQSPQKGIETPRFANEFSEFKGNIDDFLAIKKLEGEAHANLLEDERLRQNRLKLERNMAWEREQAAPQFNKGYYIDKSRIFSFVDSFYTEYVIKPKVEK